VRDLKIWAGSIAVIIAGLLFGVLHQWPPQPMPPRRIVVAVGALTICAKA
jgi:membrane protease YdiL (CAAX protease family)